MNEWMKNEGMKEGMSNTNIFIYIGFSVSVSYNTFLRADSIPSSKKNKL